MKVECIETSGAEVARANPDRGYTARTVFDLRIGETYVVHGICLYHGLVMYLVDPAGDSLPNWYPASLFRISDNRLPASWRAAYSMNEAVSMLIGYEELVGDASHFDLLANRDMDALRVFVRRRGEASEVTERPTPPP